MPTGTIGFSNFTVTDDNLLLVLRLRKTAFRLRAKNWAKFPVQAPREAQP